MNRLATIAVCLAGGLVWNTGFGAGSPYAPIAERNIFGLNPPQAVTPIAPEPPSKITLNGIMTIFGTTQALFLVDVPPRPPTPATQKSYILSEGQGQDDIEVTHIDEKKNVVTFNNHGVVQEIPLVKAPPITTPTPVVMNPGFNTPGVAPGGYNNYRGGGEGGNAAQFGNRFGQNQNPNMGNNAVGNNPGNPGGPGFNNTGSQTAAPAQQRLSPEEQMIMIAAQHAQAQQAGDPMSRIFPPTDLDAAAGVVPETPVGSPSTP
jgi:hypothetical protein